MQSSTVSKNIIRIWGFVPFFHCLFCNFLLYKFSCTPKQLECLTWAFILQALRQLFVIFCLYLIQYVTRRAGYITEFDWWPILTCSPFTILGVTYSSILQVPPFPYSGRFQKSIEIKYYAEVFLTLTLFVEFIPLCISSFALQCALTILSSLTCSLWTVVLFRWIFKFYNVQTQNFLKEATNQPYNPHLHWRTCGLSQLLCLPGLHEHILPLDQTIWK